LRAQAQPQRTPPPQQSDRPSRYPQAATGGGRCTEPTSYRWPRGIPHNRNRHLSDESSSIVLDVFLRIGLLSSSTHFFDHLPRHWNPVLSSRVPIDHSSDPPLNICRNHCLPEPQHGRYAPDSSSIPERLAMDCAIRRILWLPIRRILPASFAFTTLCACRDHNRPNNLHRLRYAKNRKFPIRRSGMPPRLCPWSLPQWDPPRPTLCCMVLSCKHGGMPQIAARMVCVCKRLDYKERL